MILCMKIRQFQPREEHCLYNYLCYILLPVENESGTVKHSSSIWIFWLKRIGPVGLPSLTQKILICFHLGIKGLKKVLLLLLRNGSLLLCCELPH